MIVYVSFFVKVKRNYGNVRSKTVTGWTVKPLSTVEDSNETYRYIAKNNLRDDFVPEPEINDLWERSSNKHFL